jgi:inorganic pyrophosphatase
VGAGVLAGDQEPLDVAVFQDRQVEAVAVEAVQTEGEVAI